MSALKMLRFAKGILQTSTLTSRSSLCARCLSAASTPGDVVGFEFQSNVAPYKLEDCILYNIGVGASLESNNSRVMRFLYEKDPDFSVIPTFSTLAINAFLRSMYNNFPLKLDFSQLYHGEHYVEIIQPIDPTGGELMTKTTVVDVADKGKGTVFVFDGNSFDQKGNHIFYNQTVVFTTQFGKWGGKRQTDCIKPTFPTPDRAPDVTITEKISMNQAALYRLTGDNNPMHIDPEVASRAGFPRPILHGLCFYGFSARNVIEQFCDYNTLKFKSSKLRFSSPVLPGQSIKTDMWKESSRVHFTTTNLDTGKVAISGGHVDLAV